MKQKAEQIYENSTYKRKVNVLLSEDNYALISSHVQRVRDLTEQAANGTYGEQSKKAIESEIKARLDILS